jgi:hypothetical protein
VQALVVFPDALERLGENISWTTELGDAFLAQQSDVTDAVQRLRRKAKQEGKLTSNEQQTVTSKQLEQRTVVEIQPASTQVEHDARHRGKVPTGGSRRTSGSGGRRR